LGLSAQIMELVVKSRILGKDVPLKPVPATRFDIDLSELGDKVESAFGNYALRVTRLFIEMPDVTLQ